MQTSIKKLTNEHEEWKSSLAFYKDEIKFFKNRLNEVSEKNNTKPILENVEHFQNQLDIHDEKISGLKHEIDQYVHDVFTDSTTYAEHITPQTAEKFETLKGKVGITSKLFDELKTEYKQFLEKVL